VFQAVGEPIESVECDLRSVRSSRASHQWRMCRSEAPFFCGRPNSSQRVAAAFWAISLRRFVLGRAWRAGEDGSPGEGLPDARVLALVEERVDR